MDSVDKRSFGGNNFVLAVSTSNSVKSLLSIEEGSVKNKDIKHLTNDCKVPVYNPVTKSLPTTKRYFLKSETVTRDAFENSGLAQEVRKTIKFEARSIKPRTALQNLNDGILKDLQELSLVSSQEDAEKDLFYSGTRIEVQILGRIFDKFINGLPSLSGALSKLKEKYHDIISNILKEEETFVLGQREQESDKRQNHELLKKMHCLEKMIEELKEQKRDLNLEIERKTSELDIKKKLILTATETLYDEHPRNGITKRQYILDWLQDQTGAGLNCTRELKYLAENPDLFRETNDRVLGVTHSQFKHISRASSSKLLLRSSSAISKSKSIHGTQGDITAAHFNENKNDEKSSGSIGTDLDVAHENFISGSAYTVRTRGSNASRLEGLEELDNNP